MPEHKSAFIILDLTTSLHYIAAMKYITQLTVLTLLALGPVNLAYCDTYITKDHKIILENVVVTKWDTATVTFQNMNTGDVTILYMSQFTPSVQAMIKRHIPIDNMGTSGPGSL